jgi:hypothetical protein
MILSLANIEDLAEAILKDYLGALPDDANHVHPIDIEAFASRCLGLNVAYTRLSDNGDVLGLTTYADVEGAGSYMESRYQGGEEHHF